MGSIKARARLAGSVYLVMGLLGYFSLMYVPDHLIVRGDAATTAHNITNSELLYRFGILSQLVSQILFIYLALLFYDLFRNVDRKQAALLVALVAVSVAVEFANTLNLVAPLIVLSDANFLAAFTKAQLEALAMGFLRLRNAGVNNVSAFWGLWLFPLGLLVIRSGWFPKVLGVLLIVSSVAYVIGSATSVIAPMQMHTVSMFTLTLGGIGEFAIILWLIIFGANADRVDATAHVAAA